MIGAMIGAMAPAAQPGALPGGGPGPVPGGGAGGLPGGGAGGLPGMAGVGGGASVPDPSTMLPLVPAAATAGPPPAIKTGTRLTYFGMSASVPGAGRQLVLDDNGHWIDKGTGQRYSEENVPGAGGAGFNVVHVGYVDRDIVQLSSKLYLWDPMTRQSSYSMGSGIVGHAGCAADYWIHPDVLKTVADADQGGVRIMRMPYNLNNRVYNAIRFQVTSAKGYQAYVYDLASGLMIFHGSSTQGASVWTPPIGGSGQAGVGQGSTQLVTGWIVEVKDIDVPWKQMPPPQWVGQFRAIQFAGVQSSIVAGAGQFDRQMQLTVTPKERGREWVRFSSASIIQSVAGLPPEQGEAIGTSGVATLGGLWVPPEALATMRQGQVLEQNEHVGTTMTVSAAGGGAVMISEVGPKHRIDCTYDVRNGVLNGMNLEQQIGLGRIIHRVQRTSGP
jgi:hypothetical protein